MTTRRAENLAARLGVLGVLALFSFGPVAAQTPVGVWQGSGTDNGSLIFGSASLPEPGLRFACTAPSPQGVPLMQTGSQESHMTDPYEIYIRVYEPWFSWQDPWWQRGVTLTVDGVPYVLPDFQLNELQGSAVFLNMAAPLVQALFEARSLVLTTPEGVARDIPVAGLGAALDTGFRACVNRWVQTGHPVPAALSRFNRPPVTMPAPAPAAPAIPRFAIGTGTPAPQPQAPASPAPLAGIPRFDLPAGAVRTPPVTLPGLVSPQAAPPAPVAAMTIAQLPAVIPQQVREMCGGRARIEDSALRQAGDLDGDGAPDYIIHYTDVYCQPDNIRGFCGAANCSIDVFMSSRAYIRPFEFLAIDVEPVLAPDGRPGLRMFATPFICADGACDAVWTWNGQTLTTD